MGKNLNLGNFLTISRSNISKLQVFLKNRFHSNWRSFLVLTSSQKPNKNRSSRFWKKYQSVWFRANLETFSQISPNQEFFFETPALWIFCFYSHLTSCKKSGKSLEPLLRKLRYKPTKQPTNQPLTNYYQQHRSYRASLTPV